MRHQLALLLGFSLALERDGSEETQRAECSGGEHQNPVYELDGWLDGTPWMDATDSWAHGRRIKAKLRRKGVYVCEHACYCIAREGVYLGNKIQVSPPFSCVHPVCRVELESGAIFLHSASTNDAGEDPRQFPQAYSGPPAPLRLFVELQSTVRLNLTVPGSTRGAIWFRPAFWGMAGYAIRLGENGSRAERSHFTSFTPISEQDVVRGLVRVEHLPAEETRVNPYLFRVQRV